MTNKILAALLAIAAFYLSTHGAYLTGCYISPAADGISKWFWGLMVVGLSCLVIVCSCYLIRFFYREFLEFLNKQNKTP